MFGVQVENEMEIAGSKAKDPRQGNAAREAVLKRFLEGTGEGQFRDPAAEVAAKTGKLAGGEDFFARSRSGDSAR